ncbi:MAG: DUF4082 domain-containing protein [Geobacteraceae bacterium]|nr:DUF4082 domain-containing protein [Geobacteraceae bacterium]
MYGTYAKGLLAMLTTVSVLLGLSCAAPCAASVFTIWPASSVPAVIDTGPDSAVELGVKFRSDVSGTVTGVRFYKAGTNTGTHTGTLWTNSGTLLATATFSGESASGWQQVDFPAPVTIAANTIYVVSYHTNTGHYSDNLSYFAAAGVDNPPLHALADGVAGYNGVFVYGSGSSFPSQGWKSSNYWVDVVFSATIAADTTPPVVSDFSVPAVSATLTVPIVSFIATDDIAVSGYLVNESATAPLPSDSGWSASIPVSYTCGSAGSKTLYAWARDAAGNVSAGKSATVDVSSSSAGPEPAGWYAGDMHVHRSCGAAPESIASVCQRMAPQRLSVISLLADMGNGEVQDPVLDLPRVNGLNDPVSTTGQIVHWDTEWHWDAIYTQYPHQALGGHVVALGLSEAHQIWEEYTYPIFQWAHSQNGIAGFVHMQYLDDNIPQTLTCCTPIEYPVEVALGAADFIEEDVNGSDSAINAYYRLLNSGFRPGFAAGTDYPCNNGTELGSLLTYVQVAGGDMTYRNWIEGIAAGRTVVSRNGHNEFLDLKVNTSAAPGDEIRLAAAGSVPVTIIWTANVPLSGTIELVQNGVVVASRTASAAAGTPAVLNATVAFTQSGWLAARRMDANGHQSHTGAVFVLVNNAPIRVSVSDAEFYVQWMDNLLTKTAPGGVWSSFFINSGDAARARYQAAKAVFQQIALDAAAAVPPTLTGYTLWPATTVPGLADAGPDSAVELGLRFRADSNGYVNGIRFYKAVSNSGTHVGNLWTDSGTLLATATFTSESASGWQEVDFATPVAITANTVYVVSYHTNTGHYSDDLYFFQAKGVDAAPLHALPNDISGYNGVYAYGTASRFPNLSWNSSNYWVDVVFSPSATADTTAPAVTAFSVPATSAAMSVPITSFSATDNVAVTGYLVNESATAPSAGAAGWSASPTTSYSFTTTGTKILYAWAKDAAGNVSPGISATVSLPSDFPILLVSSAANPFSGYYAEILRAEGFNAFAETDISLLSASQLAAHDVVILGGIALDSQQVALLSDWVNAGGKLIAMHPDKKLSGLLGLSDLYSSISDAYLLVTTSSGPGAGIVNETIQFHGPADIYALNGATSLASLYSDTATNINHPAVSLNSFGTNGGQAAAFTYDLARSIVYTRQGNPSWSGQERDGYVPIRSDDLYYGNAPLDPHADWINLDKAAIPQADEQQRLLANLIIRMNQNRKPLPRFWYLPRNLPAVIVMTGDDHGYNGTAGRFDSYLAISPQNCSVDNWECIRGTSYLYTTTPLSNDQALAYSNKGFEVGIHISTNCADWTPATLESFYASQLSAWRAKYTSLPAPTTHRTHCIVWSDYATQPQVELAHGIRLDTNYYYYPGVWIADRPGFFTGSGIPMRFADSSGRLIDVYQAATQMTDESGQTFPYTVDALLDNAIGPRGYYGAFVANMHTDTSISSGSDAIVNSARARGIPVITARQLLKWLDGRNSSTFGSLAWDGTTLGFTMTVGQGANGLVAMVPVVEGHFVTNVTCNGSPQAFDTVKIKGIPYARFTALNGACQVSYASDVTPPEISTVAPLQGATNVSTLPQISAVFNELLDPGSVTSATFEVRNPASVLVPATVAYDATAQKATLEPAASLASSTNYTVTIKGGTNGVKDLAGNPLASDFSWTFGTTATSNASYSIWPAATVPRLVDSGPDNAVELGMKFRADVSGYVTGIRFYKASTNSGLHVGNLWTDNGTLLATAPFTGESASGWQQVLFPAAVPISANTDYVVSYHTSAGHYSDDYYYFNNSGVDSPPLHAPANGVSGYNGVYAYGSTSRFPNLGWNSSNYWVDVVFRASPAPLLTSLTVTPANQRIAIGTVQQFTATGIYSDGSTQNLTSQVTWNSSDTGVATITGTGLVTASTTGVAAVSATLNGISGSTNLTVTDQIGFVPHDRFCAFDTSVTMDIQL